MTTADRCTLLTMTESIQCFIELLAQKVILLTRHHHLLNANPVSETTEGNHPTSECIIVGYFLLCSSRVSLGKHTGNIAPIHCVLQKRIGSLGVDSHCIISDTTQHTTSTVYAYQKTLLDGLKVKHSAITKVHYFSDGSGQYKNRYNFINLCFHNEDCGLLAGWNSFATTHGKIGVMEMEVLIIKSSILMIC